MRGAPDVGALCALVMERVVELNGGADEEGHEALMFVDGERFGEKVGQVVGPLPPNDAELCL